MGIPITAMTNTAKVNSPMEIPLSNENVENFFSYFYCSSKFQERSRKTVEFSTIKRYNSEHETT